MRRKVVQQGHETKVISLPMKWTRKYQLNKGDEIDLQIEGETLLIRPAIIKDISEDLVLDGHSLKSDTWKTVIYLLKSGHNVIKINGDKNELERVSRKVISRFPGFDVIDERTGSITIKHISSEEIDYSQYERKSFLVLLEFFETMNERVKSGNLKEIEELFPLEKINDKFTNICQRYLNRRGSKNYTFRWTLLWQLEKIGDSLKDLAECFLNLKNPSKEICTYFDEISVLFRNYYESYFDFDPKKLFSYARKGEKLKMKGKSLISKDKDPLVVYHILILNELIYNSFGNIVGVHANSFTK